MFSIQFLDVFNIDAVTNVYIAIIGNFSLFNNQYIIILKLNPIFQLFPW